MVIIVCERTQRDCIYVLLLEQMYDALGDFYERVPGYKTDLLAIRWTHGRWSLLLHGSHFSTGRRKDASTIFLAGRQGSV